MKTTLKCRIQFLSIMSTLLFSAGAVAGEKIHLIGSSFDLKKVQVNSVQLFGGQGQSGVTPLLIQFRQKIQAQDQKWLKGLGFQIEQYLPEDAFVVSTQRPISLKVVLKNNRVRAAKPFQAQWKLSEGFGSFRALNTFLVEKVNVTLSKNVSLTDLARLKSLGEVISAARSSVALHATRSQIEKMAQIPGVLWVEPLAEMTTFEVKAEGFASIAEQGKGDFKDLTGLESGTEIMNFSSAWARGYTGASQVVVMADTGLDTGKLETLFSDFSATSHGYFYGAHAKDWGDPMGHGTHVAGSVVSTGEGSNGAVVGGAYDAELIPQGLWSPTLNNLNLPSDFSILFEKAQEDGAYIHTNSWGSPRNLGAYDSNAALVDRFMWENPDMLVIFAAGNSGIDADRDGRVDEGSVSSPGTAKNALTVGASENEVETGGIQRKLGELAGGKNWGVEPMASDTLSNNRDGIACFSSRGPTADGRLKPEVVAPGTNILSNCSHVSGASPLWGKFNKDYCWSGGTSMSTPLVAGGAAVVREYLQKEWDFKKPTGALVKALLMHTATDLYPGQYGEGAGQELLIPGPNMNQGFGRVNMDQATAGKTGSVILLMDERAGVAAGEEVEAKLPADLTGVTGLKVTLVYMDAPGSPGAARSLVNDLDLVLIDSSGKEYRSEDRVNNHEQLVVENLPEGQLTLKVEGHSVPMGIEGKQPFAMVVSKQGL